MLHTNQDLRNSYISYRDRRNSHISYQDLRNSRNRTDLSIDRLHPHRDLRRNRAYTRLMKRRITTSITHH